LSESPSANAAEQGILTGRGMAIIKNLFAAGLIFLLFALGFWALQQTLDSVVSLGRNFVDLPFGGMRTDVWTYHDLAYTLLWFSYVGLVVFEAAHWKPFRLTVSRVLASVFGFALLTSGLWLAQDVMDAVLVLNRDYVDMPFFVARLDLLNVRDLVSLLVTLGFLSFLCLIRLTDR